MTIAEAIANAAKRLAAQGIDNARLDAEVLLRHILGRDRAWLIAHYPDRLDDDPRRSYDAAVERRARREPLQYITGTQEFWGLPFNVTPAVLIPRPETELIVETAIRSVAGIAAPVIVDLCTGSGCIAVSLAHDLPGARVFATDRSDRALAVARQNARMNAVADRIRFCEGDLFTPLEEMDLRGRVDVIATNPPYVRESDRPALQPEVRDFEPEMALFAGPLGTEIAEKIITAAVDYLIRGGSLIMEMGIGQADALSTAVRKNGNYRAHEVLKDLAGIDRVIVAQIK